MEKYTMASEIDSKAPKCNYFGDPGKVGEQTSDLRDIHNVGPDAENSNLCTHYVGDEPVQLLDTDLPPLNIKDAFHPDDIEYTVFNFGPSNDMDEMISKRYATLEQSGVEVKVLKFRAYVLPSSDYLKETEGAVFNVEKYLKDNFSGNGKDFTLLESIQTDSGATPRGWVEFYVVGYGNDFPYYKQTETKKEIPEYGTFNCPEYFTHQREAKGDISLDGWELFNKGNGRFEAIPRFELQGRLENGNAFANEDAYRTDLRGKLGFSEYINNPGEGTFRYLKPEEIVFKGADDVYGLKCPIFEVTIHEVVRSEETCLEWINKKESSEMPNALEVHTNGYVQDQGPNTRIYITSSNDADVAGQLESWKSEFSPDVQARYKFSYTKISDDGVCAHYKFTRTALPKADPKPSGTPQGKDDTKLLIKMHSGNPETVRKLTLTSGLGPIEEATSKTGGGGSAPIDKIENDINDLPETEWIDIVLVIDQSGSMTDDIAEMSKQLYRLVDAVKRKAKGGHVALVAMHDGEVIDHPELAVRWGINPILTIEDDERGCKAKLAEMQQHLDGGLEYIAEAGKVAVNELERYATPGSERLIFLLTDEPGNFMSGDQNAEAEIAAVRASADAIGAKFKIKFINRDTFAYSGTEAIQEKLLFDHMRTANIAYEKMNPAKKIEYLSTLAFDTGLGDQLRLGAYNEIKKVHGSGPLKDTFQEKFIALMTASPKERMYNEWNMLLKIAGEKIFEMKDKDGRPLSHYLIEDMTAGLHYLIRLNPKMAADALVQMCLSSSASKAESIDQIFGQSWRNVSPGELTRKNNIAFFSAIFKSDLLTQDEKDKIKLVMQKNTNISTFELGVKPHSGGSDQQWLEYIASKKEPDQKDLLYLMEMAEKFHAKVDQKDDGKMDPALTSRVYDVIARIGASGNSAACNFLVGETLKHYKGAAYALIQTKDPRTSDILMRVIDDLPYVTSDSNILLTLIGSKDPKVIPILKNALIQAGRTAGMDENEIARKMIDGIKNIGGKEALDALNFVRYDLNSTEKFGIKIPLLKAMQSLGADVIQDELKIIRALFDSGDVKQEYAACQYIRELKLTEFADDVAFRLRDKLETKTLNDPYDMSGQLIETLGAIGSDVELPLLSDIIEQGNTSNQHMARQAIRKIQAREEQQ